MMKPHIIHGIMWGFAFPIISYQVITGNYSVNKISATTATTAARRLLCFSFAPIHASNAKTAMLPKKIFKNICYTPFHFFLNASRASLKASWLCSCSRVFCSSFGLPGLLLSSGRSATVSTIVLFV